MKGFKFVVSFWDKHGSLRVIFPLLLEFFELPYFIFNLLFSMPFATNTMLGPGPYTTKLLVPVSDREKKVLKQYGVP